MVDKRLCVHGCVCVCVCMLNKLFYRKCKYILCMFICEWVRNLWIDLGSWSIYALYLASYIWISIVVWVVKMISGSQVNLVNMTEHGRTSWYVNVVFVKLLIEIYNQTTMFYLRSLSRAQVVTELRHGSSNNISSEGMHIVSYCIVGSLAMG